MGNFLEMTRPLNFQPSAEERMKDLKEALEKINDPLEQLNYRIAYWQKLDAEIEEWEASRKKRDRAAKEELQRQKMQEARERVAIADLLKKAEEAWLKRQDFEKRMKACGYRKKTSN